MTNDPRHRVRGAEELDDFLQLLLEVALERDDLPEEDTPLGKLSREFFRNNWTICRDGLLRCTTRIRVQPEPGPAPCVFRFQIASRYKRKFDSSSVVELMPGPVRGRVLYRGDLFEHPGPPTVAVLLDHDQGYFHPNYARKQGILCIGDEQNFPPGPLPLDVLLENHVYPIVTCQNRRPAHPADLEAARYFALEPTAMEGLEPDRPVLVNARLAADAVRRCEEAGGKETGGAVLGKLIRLPQPLPGTETRIVTLLSGLVEDHRHVGMAAAFSFSPEGLAEAARIADVRGLGESVLTVFHSHGWSSHCRNCRPSAGCSLAQCSPSLQDYEMLSLFPSKGTLMPIVGRKPGVQGERPVLRIHAWRGGQLQAIHWQPYED